tara:strand:- start:42 stop:482 length:441 start_codon:yes stop_codon:yes gene_type:complete
MDLTFPQMLESLMLRKRPFIVPCSNYYEAASLIREAFENFWETVKEKDSVRDGLIALEELLDIASHCWRIAEDLELVRVDSASEIIRQELHTERQRLIEAKLEQILNTMESYHKQLPPMQKGEPSTWCLQYNQKTVEEIRDTLDYQ